MAEALAVLQFERHAELFQDLFNAAPDAMVVTDEWGKIVLVDKQSQELFGYDQEELLGQDVEKLLPDSFRDRHRRHRAHYLNNPHPRAMGAGLELYALHKDGYEIPVEISLSPLKTSQGLLILSAIRDISERKRSEAELRRRAQQQRVVADLGLYALQTTDLQALMNEVAQRMREALEVEFSKILELQPSGEALLLKAGSGWREGCVGRVTMGTGTKSLAGYTLLSGQPVIAEDLTTETRFEVPPLLHDHGVMSSMTVVIHGNGRPYGVLGVDSVHKSTFDPDDIHTVQAVAGLLSQWIRRRQAEDALERLNAELERRVEERTQAWRNSEQRFSTAFHASPAPTVIRRLADLQVVDVNKSFLQMTGYSRDEIVGKTPGELEVLVEPGRRRLMLESIRQGQPSPPVEFDIRTKLGELRQIIGVSSPIELHGEPCLLITFIDITVQKDAEAELKRRVRQQSAIAELGLFAVKNHDLQALMDEASRRLAEVLEVEYCKVLELQPDGKSLLLKAGTGWQEGYVGRASVSADLGSQAGYTLRSEEPVIVSDLREETRFRGPPLLHEHGVISGLSVIIQGTARPYGVLGAHTVKKRRFAQEDINLLQAVANLLCHTVEREQAEAALRVSQEQFSRVFHASPVPTAVVRLADLRYLDANERFLKALEYERGELVGRVVHELEQLLGREPRHAASSRLGLSQPVPPTEVDLHTKLGNARSFIAAAEPIEFRGEVCWLATLIDITERKQTEEELMQAFQMVMQDAAWFSRSVMEKLTQLRSRNVDRASMAELTQRERQVLALLARGLDNGQIAADLELAKRTVHNYVNRIYEKLQVRSRAEAIVWARERGLIQR